MITLPGRVGGVKTRTNHKKAIDSVELWESRLVQFGVNKPPIPNQYFSTRGCANGKLRNQERLRLRYIFEFGIPPCVSSYLFA